MNIVDDHGERNPENGYDIPIYGLDNGTFYAIHIPAIICIVISFVCAMTSLILSFRRNSASAFFTKWTKSQRFIVYMAICDGLFNICHFTDHIHVVIAKNMVYPKELCEFYGFNLTVFISAQNLLVVVIAVNAFMLIYFDKTINFGRFDWMLLTWTFGIPVIGATVAWITGKLGPNGSFCYFDDVKAKLTKIFFTSVPLLVILFTSTILYVVTWMKIYHTTLRTRAVLGQITVQTNATQRTAITMTMFVLAFIVQWLAGTIYGVWTLVDDEVPQPVVHLITIFTNIGGVLTLCVYMVMSRRHLCCEKSMQRQNAKKHRQPEVHVAHISHSCDY